MDKKQLLQSLLFKIPAIKQTKRPLRFERVSSSLARDNATRQVLGLSPVSHPNQKERTKIGQLAILNPLDNHRHVDIPMNTPVKLFTYDPKQQYQMHGVTTVVQNGTQSELGPEREANLIMVTQLKANNAI